MLSRSVVIAVSKSQMRDHVQELCAKHQLAWYPCKRTAQAKALRDCDEFFAPPIRSVITYAVALHEIGHLLGRHQHSRMVMVREDWAWRWARASALIWTPTMERFRRRAFAVARAGNQGRGP
jgi:hypothetical protein